jgi:hypothetical protein
MKSLNVIFFFFLLSLGVSGQMVVLPATELIKDNSGQIRSSINKTLSNIEGTPYVFDQFVDGVVFPKDRNNAFRLKLNVNAYSDMFEFEFDDKVYEMPNFTIDSVIIGNSTFIPVVEFKDDKVNFYSMEILARDGKGNFLVKQYVVHLLEATMAKAYRQAEPTRYQSYPVNYYFYNVAEQKLTELKNVKKLKDDPRYSGQLKVFFKENRIRSRNIDDLIELFNFIYIAGLKTNSPDNS